MFLIFLLLTISFDILLFKILTYKKKDEKEYFYKVNKELGRNFIKNCPYKGTVYFNSEFITKYFNKKWRRNNNLSNWYKCERISKNRFQ